MKVLEYIKAKQNRGEKYPVIPRIECNDGFSISVQASSGHYCQPREDGCDWFQVECGFPSERCEQLMPYADNPKEDTDTVYGYVPIEIVDELIASHGGIKNKP